MDECFFGLADGSKRAPPPGAAHIPRVILVVVVAAGAGHSARAQNPHLETQQLTIKLKLKRQQRRVAIYNEQFNEKKR